jgi:hypothetical protein
MGLNPDPKVNPKVAHQIQLEQLFSKNQLIPRIKGEFEQDTEINYAAHMADHGIPLRFGYDLLTQMALHKRPTLPVLVGILRHHFDDSQLTADMILRCCEANMLDWDPALELLIVRFTVTDDVQDDLDRFQFPLPMVVRPKRILTNTDIGYLTSTGSVILKKNHHDDDVCLDHLNRVNQVRFAIDHDTALMIKNEWRNLDKPKEGETRDDFLKRVKAFDKYDATAKEVIDLIVTYGNEFYLTHKYDKRGRTYCQGYHVNYGGTSWNKACVELADKELIE